MPHHTVGGKALASHCVVGAMGLFEASLAQTRLELTLARRPSAEIQSGALVPPSCGLTREQALAFFADTAAARA